MLNDELKRKKNLSADGRRETQIKNSKNRGQEEQFLTTDFTDGTDYNKYFYHEGHEVTRRKEKDFCHSFDLEAHDRRGHRGQVRLSAYAKSYGETSFANHRG